MPKVPYQGYSEVSPSTANVSIPVSGEPFGVRTAEAAGQFGGAIAGAGEKLFQRAEAFQEMHNQTESDEANVNFVNRQADLHAKYNALQGDERVKAWPAYKANTIALREEIEAGLSNDMARNYFKRKSGNELSHALFLGAASSAIAEKDYMINTANSEMDAAVKSVSDDPLNVNWDAKEASIRSAGIKIGQGKYGAGPNDSITQNIINTNISRAKRAQIEAVNFVDSPRAGQMLDDARKDKKVNDVDSQALDRSIRTSERANTGANIANKVYEAGQGTEDVPGDSPRVMEEKVRAQAKQAFGNDTVAVEHAVSALQTRIAKDDRLNRMEKANNTQTIWEAIETTEPTNIQELRAVSPHVMNAIDSMPAKDRDKLAKDLENRAKRKEVTEAGSNYKKLLVMADEDPMKFLETHLPDEKLTPGQYKSLLAVRQQKIKDPNQEPRTNKAMGWLKDAYGDTMNRLGISSSKGDNPAYYEFRGSLLQAIDAEQEKKKGPVTQDDVVNKMWPILTKQLSFPGRIYGTNEYPLWNPPTYGKSGYENFAEKIRRDAATLGTEVTEEQIKNKWKKTLYIKANEGQGGK